MKLPNVVTPEYKVKLPSGKSIKIRPFLVQEEKILLMAIEDSEKNEKSLQDALIQVLKNCIVTPDFDVNDLTSIDVDFLFIELRKKSVSDVVTLEYLTPTIFDNCPKQECPESVKTSFSLDDVEIKNNPTSNIVMLNETVGVKLRHPTLGSTQYIDENERKTEILFKTIAECIEEIFDDNDSAPASKFKKEELQSWVEKSVGHKQLEEIMEFISSAPYVSKEITLICPLCKKEKVIEAKGLADFFM